MKYVFYPIYVIVIFLVLLISFNIYDALDLFKQWGWFEYFSDLPYLGRDLLIFLCGLMIVELVIENVHIIKVKDRMEKL
ncbi:MAG: hypothetical protein OEY56_13740, partial [Cyclobacteriaceae bacterium]|nr:hypothetical protein [Cyclobacteriaceae bacterium]